MTAASAALGLPPHTGTDPLPVVGGRCHDYRAPRHPDANFSMQGRSRRAAGRSRSPRRQSLRRQTPCLLACEGRLPGASADHIAAEAGAAAEIQTTNRRRRCCRGSRACRIRWAAGGVEQKTRVEKSQRKHQRPLLAWACRLWRGSYSRNSLVGEQQRQAPTGAVALQLHGFFFFLCPLAAHSVTSLGARRGPAVGSRKAAWVVPTPTSLRGAS